MRNSNWGLVLAIGLSMTSAFGAEGRKIYGVGILGNCTTHGAGICAMFKKRPDTRVVAAYERNPRRARELQEALGAPLAKSYEEVIADPRVDIVAITCDPADKAGMVEKAAAAGKHIFLNKPMAESLDSARRIAAAVRKHHVQFVYDIPMVRSVPVYARLLDEVRAGKHGKVLGYHHLFGMNFPMDFDLKSIWPERLDPPEKSGGGEMTNMGCYALDYAVALFGRPRSVLAKWQKTWGVYRDADVENFGQIVLDYGDFFAFLEVGKQQLEGEMRTSNSMTINFEHQTFLIDADARLVSVNHIAQDYDKFSAGATAVDSVDQLIAAIEKGTPPSNDLDNAVLATETLMAAYQSILDGKVVTLPLPSGKNPLIGAHPRNSEHAVSTALAPGTTEMPAEVARRGTQALRVLSKAKPGVRWDKKSGLRADIDCDGITDYVFLGRTVGFVHVGLVRGSGQPAEVLDTKVDAGTKDSFCGAPAKLEIEPLDYDAAEVVGQPVEGFEQSTTAKGLRLSGGDCDSFHLFWNHKTNHLDWWRL